MSLLQDIVARNRVGEQVGIWSLCSAHPLVLEACAAQARDDASPLLVEATCNQVNQDGGYTGLAPAGFRDLVARIAAEAGLPAERLILGGDHLGPNPWRGLPAEAAMAKAAVMVEAYAAAGFTKLHLDCSMACADDPSPLPEATIAERAAALCAAAEAACGRAGTTPFYVVGTEVPIPGGATEALDHLAVTPAAEVERTLHLHREAFARAGVAGAAERILAIVVQPGVEFGHDEVADFVPEKARDLSAAVARLPGVAFEAHSTDYQTEAALAALVAGHFAVLKVGPGLTFALREALFALAAIEAELLPAAERSGLREALEAAMLADPAHWRAYYGGTPEEQRLARAFSLSDRCRYYWPVPSVAATVERLFANLGRRPPPLPLVSQYLPRQHDAIRAGRLPNEARALVLHKVREVAGSYARACAKDASRADPSDRDRP